MSYTEDDTCIRCGKLLDHTKSVWLELNMRTGLYCDGGVPDADSQGGFEFGAACARAIIKNGGELVRVGRAACAAAITARRAGFYPR